MAFTVLYKYLGSFESYWESEGDLLLLYLLISVQDITSLYRLHLLGPHWEETGSDFPLPETELTEIFFSSWSAPIFSLIGT